MKNLEKVLKELSASNVPGVVNHARVVREMEDVSELFYKVELVYNDRFSLEYNHNIKGFVINTTYSNQIVDESFMEELNILNKAKELLNKEVAK